MQTAAPTTWKTRVVPMCAECGTLDGHIPKGRPRPIRRNGIPFGSTGPVCATCYSRLSDAKHRQEKELATLAPEQRAAREAERARVAARRSAVLTRRLREASAFLPVVPGCPCVRWRMRFRTECDLCGVGGAISVFSGAEFDIEGRICIQCREELREERAEIRHRELTQANYANLGTDDYHTRPLCLPVLTSGFTRWDLTPRAAAQLILAETKGVFRRRVAG